MPPETPDWKQLELIVADIQRQLAPSAEVRHNQRVGGRSGRRRKLDVTVTQKIGAYTVFVVFDCKRHKKPAGLKDVAAFAEQVQDVNPHFPDAVVPDGTIRACFPCNPKGFRPF
ncbi:MAG: hypothetical protein V2A79_15560 [Planctomycetota bacterium]